MRIAGSIITAICGIVVIVGIFFAWLEYCDWVPGVGTMCFSVSGWDLMVGETSIFGVSVPLGVSLSQIYLVIAGGAAMVLFGLPTFIVSLAAKGGRAAVVTLGIFAILGALVAIGGCVWHIVDGRSALSMFDYGFYISAAAAVIGLIFAILTAAFSKGRGDW